MGVLWRKLMPVLAMGLVGLLMPPVLLCRKRLYMAWIRVDAGFVGTAMMSMLVLR